MKLREWLRSSDWGCYPLALPPTLADLEVELEGVSLDETIEEYHNRVYGWIAKARKGKYRKLLDLDTDSPIGRQCISLIEAAIRFSKLLPDVGEQYGFGCMVHAQMLAWLDQQS